MTLRLDRKMGVKKRRTASIKSAVKFKVLPHYIFRSLSKLLLCIHAPDHHVGPYDAWHGMALRTVTHMTAVHVEFCSFH